MKILKPNYAIRSTKFLKGWLLKTKSYKFFFLYNLKNSLHRYQNYASTYLDFYQYYFDRIFLNHLFCLKNIYY